MMTTQEFRPVDAKEKFGVENLQSCNEEITKVITQVNPKDYQCVAMGEYIIFKGKYYHDAIVNYKVPSEDTDYEFHKFPEDIKKKFKNYKRISISLKNKLLVYTKQ